MKNEITNFAKKLIAIPSISGNETKILDFLEAYFRENSAKSSAETFREKTFVAEKFSRKNSEKPDEKNVKNSRKTDEKNAENFAKKAVILAGHVDTVVPGNLENWRKVQPFSPKIIDGKLFGLGAADMKSSLATEIITGENFAKNAEKMDFDLWIVATANEEIDGLGSADFTTWFDENFAKKYDEKICIIADGGPEKIELGQRGNRFMEFTFSGESGHGSQFQNFAKSGLKNAAKFLAKINEINDEISRKFADKMLGKPSLTPTGISAGDEKSPNKIAADAKVFVDCRTTPEFDENFAKIISKLAKKYEFSWRNVYDPVRSSLISAEHDFVKKLREISGAEFGVSMGANDQGFFVAKNIPTVIFGAADTEQFHQTDEFVEVKKLENFAKILTKFLEKM